MTNLKKAARIEQRKKAQQRARLINRFYIAIGTIAVGALVFAIVRESAKPVVIVGQEVPIMSTIDHVLDGAEVEYNTSPPTSGSHYNDPLPAGFYQEDSQEAVAVSHPESHIVHSLEHGYVVIWYNCAGLEDAACLELKDNIGEIVDKSPLKIIVFPWQDMDEPVVLTAWGIILRLTVFDPDAIRAFIDANRSNPRAPEPNVP